MFSSKKIIFSNNPNNISIAFIDQFTGNAIENVNVDVREKSTNGFNKPVGFNRFGNVFVFFSSDTCILNISAPGYHARRTYFNGVLSKENSSIDNPLKIPLVPSSFDMSNFNSMVRGQPYSGYLQRRTTFRKFSVGIFSNYLQFISNDTYVIQAGQIKGQIPESFLKSKRDYIADSLSQITPWNYSDGNGVSNSSVYEGRNVHSNYTVLVGYYQGLRSSMPGFVGWGSWKVSSSGHVYAGHAMVDTTAGDYTLMHEIGHGMGYNHVGNTTSMMNSVANRLSDFDIKAGKILFTRSLKNTNVDNDNVDSIIGHHHPSYFESFGSADIFALSDAEENKEEDSLIVNVGCWEDGSSSLDVYKILENGSKLRIDGHERK